MDWGLILTAIGLAMFMQGLAYALFAKPLKRMALEILAQPETLVRIVGVIFAAGGLVIIWMVRGG